MGGLADEQYWVDGDRLYKIRQETDAAFTMTDEVIRKNKYHLYLSESSD